MANIGWAEIIHIHGLWTLPTSTAATLARFYHRPYIISPCGMLMPWALSRSRWKKRIYGKLWEWRNLNNASALHFLNDAELEGALPLNLRPKSFILGNGIDPDEYHNLPNKLDLEREYLELKGKVVALFLGRIHPQKGLDLLIPALKKALETVPLLHVVIAGPNEKDYRAILEKAIAANHVKHAVSFVGEVLGERKRLLLGGADFFTLPSRHEGDSVAVKEALAAGLPVLITRACSLDQVAASGAGVVTDGTINQLTAALVFLASNPIRCAAMGRDAKTMAHSLFQWREIVHKLTDVYRDILTNEHSSECWIKGKAAISELLPESRSILSSADSKSAKQ
jgi:glycosyltransferase involved in cell wall biosynthesis